MKFNELRPKYGVDSKDDNNDKGRYNGKKRYIVFDCPICKKHRVNLPIIEEGKDNKGSRSNWGIWEKGGEDFGDTSISPSIMYDIGSCRGHFRISRGEVEIV